MRKSLKPAILLLSCVLAAAAFLGCVKMDRAPVDKQFFALDVARPGEALPAAKGPALMVRRLQISPRVAGRELVYKVGESGWTADYYNQFFTPPADMLSQDLRTWLRASGLYSNVVDPGSLLEPRLILEGNVTSLYGDLTAKPGTAVVQMQFLLLDNAGAERRVLMTRDVSASAPLAGATPRDLVLALRTAVARCFGELEGALRQVPPPQ